MFCIAYENVLWWFLDLNIFSLPATDLKQLVKKLIFKEAKK